MNHIIQQLKGGPAAIRAAAASNLDALTADEIVAANSLTAQIVREAQALSLALAAAGSRKNAHKSAGAASMDSLIATSAGISRSEAAKRRRLAERLQDAPVLRGQMTKAGMSTEKAHVITDTMRTLPDDLSDADRQTIEDDFALAAPNMSLEELKRKSKRPLEIIDTARADRLENEQLIEQERRAARKTSFWMTRPDDDGMVKGSFEIDALTADFLRSYIESHTSPRKVSTSGTQVSTGSTTENGVSSTGGNGIGSISETTGNSREYKHKAGDAFTHLLRHLPADQYGNHGGMPATLVVTINEDSLRARTDAAGVTEHGTAVSAGQVRQIACNSGILPTVLGGASEILDFGREKRLHTSAQRRALAQRDLGCAFPGCDRPPGWTEAHHVDWWDRDHGGTSVDRGVLLCVRHHHHIHEWDIPIRIAHGIAEFKLPHNDIWQRNTRYRRAT